MQGEYYKTKESVQEYIRLAKDVSGVRLIERLKEKLTLNSNVLEIGSGPGTDWKILNEFYHVVGSDNSAEFIKHLSKHNPKGEFLELDASTLKTDKKFNGIYSNKVMHHLNESELKDSILRQSEILNSEGIVFHSFWKGEGSEIFKGLYVKYHTVNSIREAFSDHFEILEIDIYAEFEEGDSLLLIAKKKHNY